MDSQEMAAPEPTGQQPEAQTPEPQAATPQAPADIDLGDGTRMPVQSIREALETHRNMAAFQRANTQRAQELKAQMREIAELRAQLQQTVAQMQQPARQPQEPVYEPQDDDARALQAMIASTVRQSLGPALGPVQQATAELIAWKNQLNAQEQQAQQEASVEQWRSFVSGNAKRHGMNAMEAKLFEYELLSQGPDDFEGVNQIAREVIAQRFSASRPTGASPPLAGAAAASGKPAGVLTAEKISAAGVESPRFADEIGAFLAAHREAANP